MRDCVRFLLGDELKEIRSVDPTMTVLDWLRLSERKTGTKEGCAEGDCGACTVVVGRLEGGSIRYEAVNACIRFVATLDGCQVLTVEHLKAADGTLHPVQQAMVDCHGSQCGFCTPGFVMSMFALYHNDPNPTPTGIDDALAGNLCRCTGYIPIAAASQRMYEIADPASDRFAHARAAIAEGLKALKDDETLRVGEGNRVFYAPATLDAFATLLAENPEARIVSGATDVGLWVTKFQRILDVVIYTGRIQGFLTGGRADLMPVVDEFLRPVAGLGPFTQVNFATPGTDHYDFMMEGVPSLMADQESATYGPNYHARSDTFDKADARQLKLNAAIAGAVTWGFANRDKALPRLSGTEVEAIVEKTDLKGLMQAFDLYDDYTAGRRGRRP